MKKLIIFSILVGLIYAQASIASPSPRSGEIRLNNFKVSGKLLKINSDFELVTGSELLSIWTEGWQPFVSYSNYDLKLIPGQDNILRFIVISHAGNNDSRYDRIGHCAFRFENITASKANFSVIEDSVLFGCGLDEGNTLKINRQ